MRGRDEDPRDVGPYRGDPPVSTVGIPYLSSGSHKARDLSRLLESSAID